MLKHFCFRFKNRDLQMRFKDSWNLVRILMLATVWNNFEYEPTGNGNAKTLFCLQVQEPRASNNASLGTLQHRQIDVFFLHLGRKERWDLPKSRSRIYPGNGMFGFDER